MKVKVFDEQHEDDLTDAIQTFLDQQTHIHIVDIKFSTACCIQEEEQIYCFSALLMYEEVEAYCDN